MLLDDIWQEISKCNKIAIFGHVSPDFDCLGSAFALYEFLANQKNKQIDIFVDGKITSSEKRIFNQELINNKEFKKENYDMIIVVDTPTKMRLGTYGSEIAEHNNIVKIDHHFCEEIDNITEKYYIEDNSASCCELVYILLKKAKANITSEIATYLYSGISTDTNSFLNDNTTVRSMKTAAELFEKGAEVHKVNEVSYKSVSMESWELTKLAYSKAEFYDKFALVVLNKRDLRKVGENTNNLSKFANALITVDNIELACSISEKTLKSFACSFRSVLGVRADEIAKKLGGGGHRQAAACVIGGTEKQVKQIVLNAIKDYFKEDELNKYDNQK